MFCLTPGRRLDVTSANRPVDAVPYEPSARGHASH